VIAGTTRLISWLRQTAHADRFQHLKTAISTESYGNSGLGGRSLPLDVGVSTDIPAAIRRAVIERDQHCRFPNGCDQPAAGCEVHHLTHKADGGKTSVKDCILFCTHHHQVEIHRNGWTVALNPDGTTTAWNKDRTKTLHSHSHSPPPRPG
jgi:hypothetical protein